MNLEGTVAVTDLVRDIAVETGEPGFNVLTAQAPENAQYNPELAFTIQKPESGAFKESLAYVKSTPTDGSTDPIKILFAVAAVGALLFMIKGMNKK